jgi:hypothetical protein
MMPRKKQVKQAKMMRALQECLDYWIGMIVDQENNISIKSVVLAGSNLIMLKLSNGSIYTLRVEKSTPAR